MHPMDALNRSDFVKEEGGLGYCKITKRCQAVCPVHIIITDDAIIPEKERVVDRKFRRSQAQLERVIKRVLKYAFWVAILAPFVILPLYYLLVAVFHIP